MIRRISGLIFGYCLDIGGAPGIVTNSAPRLFVYLFYRSKVSRLMAGIEPEKGINAISAGGESFDGADLLTDVLMKKLH